MRYLITILIFGVLFLFISELNAQKVNYYYGLKAGMILSDLSGSDGKMEIDIRRNRVKDLKHVGVNAYGDYYPFIGASIGAFGGFLLSERFTADMSISYLNKGFQDIFQYSMVDTFYRSSIILQAHYVDFGFKIRYVERGFIINTGFIIGANIIDRVNTNIEWTVNNIDILKQNETKYMHEHYGVYRKPFVLAYVWGLGYRKGRLTFLLNMEKTGSIFHESSIRYNFIAYSFGIEYRLNRIDKRVRRN
jgi:hypothetical protein